MLKITLHDGPDQLRFQLEGKLVGPWVAELAQCWTTAQSIAQNKPTVIDLEGVTFIDEAGEDLLERISAAGARLIATEPLTRLMVEEAAATTSGHAKKRRCLAILTHLPIFFGLILMAGIAFGQQPAIKLTLRDAVAIALRQNPQIQIANLNLVEANQGEQIARSALLPQVTAEANDRITRANIAAQFGMRLPGFPQHIGPFNVVEAGIGFAAPVFDLALFRRYQLSRQDTKTAAAQQNTVREQYVLLVVSQYLGGLRATADVKAARSRVELAKALLDQATDLLNAGAGTRIDTLRADVEYQNERQRLIVAETDLRTALYGVSRLLNLDPQQPVELADAVSFFATPAFDAAATLEAAYNTRPEMLALRSQIRSLELRKKAASDERLPRLTISGGWLEQGLTPGSAIPVYQYEAGLQVPLFTGGRIRTQTAVAGVELSKAEQTERDLRSRIADEVKTAADRLQAARSEVDVANQALRLAEEEVEQARDRFQAGVTNNIEVITAQNELARANDNQIFALYRYNQARADLAHATGQMESLYAK